MKIKRHKQARKILSFFKTNFGLREPYQVLIDGTFCQAALQGKIQLKEQLPKYLGGTVHLVTTRCIIQELRGLGGKVRGAHYIAKTLQQRHCSHPPSTSLSAADCIDCFIGDSNDKHYLVATQDPELRIRLKDKPGVPLIHIVRNTIVLEGPSNATMSRVDEVVNDKINPSTHEQSVIAKLNTALPQKEERKKKRRRPKGPNPLSVKKSTKCRTLAKPLGRGVVSDSKKRRLRLMRRKAIEAMVKKIQEAG